MIEKSDGISAAEGNDLGKDAMKIEERDKYEESEVRGQSMEHPRISNAGTGVDTLEMNFDGKSYVHGQHHQFLMMKEKYDTSKDIDTHMYLANYVIFTQMTEKKGIKKFVERAVDAMFKE